MPYDFYLKRKGRGRFPAEALAAMHKRVQQMPSYEFSDSLYILFETPEMRDSGLPRLLQALKNGGRDVLHPLIHLEAKEVILSVAGGSEADRHLYDFALWCQQRYECGLFEGSHPALPEDMVPEDWFRVPDRLSDEDSPALPEDMAEK